MNTIKKIKLGISSCLLGEKVRYDGGHRLDRFLTGTLGQYVEYVPVCPEVECGLPIPREPMHLEGNPESPRLVTTQTKQDMTDRMVTWAYKRMSELAKEDLWGFIFKSNSPSSGMERVRVYNEKKRPVKKGVGLFAKLFMEHFPLLPAEDERRLHDPGLRDNFIERIFTMKKWREIRTKQKSHGNVLNFHRRHKLLILSHSPKYYHTMERLIAKAKDLPWRELYQPYETLLMESLRLRTTPGKNANVLMHVIAHFRRQFTSKEKEELSEVIENYRKGHLPWIIPMTLIQHIVRKYSPSCLREEAYLNPDPLELQLRNHA